MWRTIFKFAIDICTRESILTFKFKVFFYFSWFESNEFSKKNIFTKSYYHSKRGIFKPNHEFYPTDSFDCIIVSIVENLERKNWCELTSPTAIHIFVTAHSLEKILRKNSEIIISKIRLQIYIARLEINK